MRRGFQVLSRVASAGAAMIGALGIAGWIWNIPRLRSVEPALMGMSIVSGIALLIAGSALMLAGVEKPEPWRRALVNASGVLVLAVALAGYWAVRGAGGVDASGDLWPGASTGLPPMTVFCLAVLGLAMLIFDRGRLGLAGHGMIAVVGFLGLLDLMGYGYGMFSHAVPYAPMALHTAVALCLVAVGYVFARPELGFVGVFTSDSYAGALVRVMLPAAILIPAILGWMHLLAESRGFYGEGVFGHAVLVMGVIVLFTGALIASIYKLNILETERRKALEKSQAAEERLREEKMFSDAAINGLPGMFVLLNEQGRYVRFNENVVRVTGYPKEEIEGKDALELVAPEDRALVAERIAEVFAKGESVAELQIYTKDGRRIPHSFTGHRLDYRGLTCLLAVGLNITERKQAEAALRESEEKFRTLADNMSQFAWMADEKGEVFWFNKRIQEYTGLAVADLLGWGWESLLHPDELERVRESVRHSARTGELWEQTFRIRSKDGKYRWFLSRSVPIRDGKGKVVRWFGTNTDITDMLEAQRALAASEERFRLFMDNNPAVAWVKDEQGRYVYFSESYKRFYGREVEDWYGKTDLEFRAPEVAEELRRNDQRVLSSGESGEFVELTHDPQGNPCWRLNTKFPFQDRARRRFVAGIGVDITQRKKVQEDLEQAKELLARTNAELEHRVQQRTAQLEETVGELEIFSYTITHDMRGPLRAMRGFSEILLSEEPELQPSSRELLERIENAARRMDQLITDALTYSRAIRGEMPLRPVDAAALLHSLIELYPQFSAPNADIVIEEPIPAVLGNEAALTQCFSNLLDNAVKFVSAGVRPKVHVWAESIESKAEEGEGNSCVRLWFEDNGIGIDPEYQGQIFEMFQQLDKGYPGTGIGLALVRKVIQRMGGSAGVESQPGVGSRFWLQLRRANGSRRAEEQRLELVDVGREH